MPYKDYHFGHLLCKIMQKKELTIQEVSIHSDCSEIYLLDILNQKENPDLSTLDRICSATGINPTIFMLKSLMDGYVKNEIKSELVKSLMPLIRDLHKEIYEEYGETLQDDPDLDAAFQARRNMIEN